MPDEDQNAPKGKSLWLYDASDEAALNAAYARAEATVPHFLATIQSPAFSTSAGTISGVKLRFKEQGPPDELEDSHYIQLWLFDVRPQAGGFTAEVINLFGETTQSIKVGDRLYFEIYQIQDWMILRQGHLWGALTLRLARAELTAEQQQKFDASIGVTVYKEGLPLANG